MKPYNLLDPTDLVEFGDLYMQQGTPIANAHLRLTPKDSVGKPAGTEMFFCREVPPLQWQTGEIPCPQKLSVLILETVDGPKTSYINNDRWRLSDGASETGKQITSYINNRLGYFTGRWYIQQIELPL